MYTREQVVGRQLELVAEAQRDHRPDGLGLDPEGDRWTGKLGVVLAQKNEAGNEIDYLQEDVGLDLKEDTYAVVLRNGLTYERTFSLQPDAASLRIIVRDAHSGNIGSLTIPRSAISRTN